ncbi:Snf7-domain-containing protein [Pelagophyceae sp. CCMP2097]|nr:Snf7-domain-containing protein [Pelagophyceae sp. CCMP2097]
MGNLLAGRGAKKPPRKKGGVSASDRAVLDLKNARDDLRKYQTKLASESSQLTSAAAELLRAGKRDRALLTLKLRRYREEATNIVEGQLFTIEQLVNTIEWETQQSSVVSALQTGTRALRDLHAATSLESVSALMDETADALAAERALSELLGGGAQHATAAEEAELADFERNCEGAAFPAAPTTLPAAPTVAPAQRSSPARPDRAAVAA